MCHRAGAGASREQPVRRGAAARAAGNVREAGQRAAAGPPIGGVAVQAPALAATERAALHAGEAGPPGAQPREHAAR